ncbi:MAG: hypothetical protein JWL84_3346 [Rhodospirillales bacterium]|jgi:hypothetical protein|nr:hypothetical protein [Rhodospirillales bacterium]
MAQFLNLCAKLGIDRPGRVPQIVKRSFSGLCWESILFLVLGYDYWFNPTDKKAEGLLQAFLMATPGSTLPQLNVSGSTSKEANSYFFNPNVSVRKEATHESVDLGFRAYGGFVEGGAANYNLCTKMLDAVANEWLESNMLQDIEKQLNNASATLTGELRSEMASCYKELRNWWGDGELTKIGLSYR